MSALPALLHGTDVLATLPHNIGGTILRGFAVAPCPVEVPALHFRQIWHVRNQNAGLNRWVRRLIVEETRRCVGALAGA